MIQANLGVDFALEDGDLLTSSNGDIQIISDTDNVVQAIINAYMTERGSLFYDDLWFRYRFLYWGEKYFSQKGSNKEWDIEFIP